MNIIIIGPRGKMGKLLIKSAMQREDTKLVAGVAPAERDYIGADLGAIAGLEIQTGAVATHNLENVIDKCDVIIDFTTPQNSMQVLEIARFHKKSVVCGTTGFSDEQQKRIEEIANEISIVKAANTSLVVNLVYKLLEITTKVIGKASDIEIVEMHDRHKMDAPSGTSKEMGNAIAKALHSELKDLAVYGRYGEGERVPGTITYHSLRAGDISSSHTVMFGLLGERLEITHHAHNWDCFANGACNAAAFLIGKKPGLYTMMDVLGI